MLDFSAFQGPNAGYIVDLYERYRQDPASVDVETQAFFENWSEQSPVKSAEADQSAHVVESLRVEGPACSTVGVGRVTAAARLARFIRQRGHLAANVDPLGIQPPQDPGLELGSHGLETGDLEILPASVVGGPLAAESQNALEAIGKLRRVYSGSIGYEDEHIQIAEERYWLRDAAESGRFFQNIDNAARIDLLERLSEVETFERYLHRTFLGAKRFSIEGTDMLLPILDEIIHNAAVSGTREVVMGMAHRGRLNVLAHVLGKPYSRILREFEDAERNQEASVSGKGSYGWTGDVKYHLGGRRAYKESGVAEMPLTLIPNPSHLEFVNPVAEGHARAAQERRNLRGAPAQDENASLPILIHGDAAFPGQGIVPETLNLSRLPGYRTGGTIHIIVNNQIGFTTTSGDARSTLYASDLAKGFEIPIVHINADDPEACIAAARMAHAYREKFRKDFLIDLIGYRRYGHNEGDEPRYTQPRMYELIDQHPTVREIWAKTLEKQGVVTRDQADALVKGVQDALQAARLAPREAKDDEGPVILRQARPPAPETGVAEERLTEYNAELLKRPARFSPNMKLEEILERRRVALTKPASIEWAHAEALAFASILADGIPVRLVGQDSERGTFGQRNLVLHDVKTGGRFVPLQSISPARASFAVYNSPLSENAALGFEYGYSVHATDTLVLWEAQFGDFANSAQVIIDQFLVAGAAKWRQYPSLVLLLPHAYEGQGPEHSSARPERFLQLAANDNLRIVNCTTPAQYFHVLRRQAALLQTDPRPLIVFTPKGLLRHPKARSSVSELSAPSFQPVIDDATAREKADQITRLILCTGHVYVDLMGSEEFKNASRVAVGRVEQLYPFPDEELRAVIAGYPNLQDIVWLQEEPCNMGAWMFIAPRIRELVGWQGEFIYSGRPEAASTAEGSLMRHLAEQKRIIHNALTATPDLPAKKPEATGSNGNGKGADPVATSSVSDRKLKPTHAG